MAGVVVDFAASTGRPLFVGNGYLAREVADVGANDSVFCVVGGMGLAPAVAGGFSRASGTPVVVLEGDGNHLMGLPATAFNGLHGIPVVHVVHWNGGWESTGGTSFGASTPVCDVGPAFGYVSTTVRDAETLQDALVAAGAADSPALVHVLGAMGDDVRPRGPLDMATAVRRFRELHAVRLP